MSFIGKVFILVSLLGLSYLLVQDQATANAFDKKLSSFTKDPLLKNSGVPPEFVAQVSSSPLLVRQVIAGLLSSSILLFLSGKFTIFPVVGLVLRILILTNPLLHKDEVTLVEFLKSLSLLGAVLLWGNSVKTSQTKVKQQ
ncbi:hypothetical protein pb186bvf_009561 [Paramecium bursaria]